MARLSRAMDEGGLLDAVGASLAEGEPLAGGSIADVRRVRGPEGEVVVKLADAADAAPLEAEADGLRALARNGRVPTVPLLAAGRRNGRFLLVVGWLPPRAPSAAAWARFGRQLAAMHAAPIDVEVRRAGAAIGPGPGEDGYGWPRPTWLGTTPQAAAWACDWPELLVGRRLVPLLRTARDAGRLAAGDQGRLERTLARLERDLPRRPRPSLLHGDLWSGNVLATPGDDPAGADDTGRLVLIDPAIGVGDAWAEIGMMELFGGFPGACLRAYDEAAGGRPPDAGRRIAAGRFLHLLNHLLIFGAGYRRRLLEEADAIERA